MREIKFRGKPTEGKWVYGSFFDSGEYAVIYDPSDKTYYQCYLESIGQYTGFKDKNGKEIYEGDAVQRFNDNPVRFPDGSKKYSSWMVVFEYGGWKFKDTPCSPTTSYPSFYSNAQYMEVIGNIYENPELLEATK